MCKMSLILLTYVNGNIDSQGLFIFHLKTNENYLMIYCLIIHLLYFNIAIMNDGKKAFWYCGNLYPDILTPS